MTALFPFGAATAFNLELGVIKGLFALLVPYFAYNKKVLKESHLKIKYITKLCNTTFDIRFWLIK